VSGEDNVKTIQAVYEAFSRGDVGFILDRVTDDVDWATDTSSTAAPWYGPHTGRAGVTDLPGFRVDDDGPAIRAGVIHLE
jgi:uncharacterized protein